MPGPNTVQLSPPESWDEFEDICADLLSREWRDPNVVRYGRSGQRQNGVDIYGKENDADVGAQCKGKHDWPPTKLTIAEIDAEVEKAKAFRPKLKKYIITTTAENDVHIIDHANAISARHAEAGQFSIHVYGWKEVLRRVRDHDDLLKKHFDIYTLSKVEKKLDSLSEAIQHLQPVQVAIPGAEAAPPATRVGSSHDALAQALERDFSNRLIRTLQRSHFPELLKADEFITLAEDVLLNGSLVSQDVRRSILLRGSRAASIRGRLEDARRYLEAAQRLAGSATDGPARARLAVAEGNPDEGMCILRDADDVDSRSVLLNIFIIARGDAAAMDWIRQEKLTAANCSAAGVLNLCQLHLRQEEFEKVNEILAEATRGQLHEGPYLYLLRGAVRFASVMPVPERALALTGIPLDVRMAQPILDGADLAVQLDQAASDLQQALPLISGLGLREAPRLTEAYLAWIDLLHPGRKVSAREQLRRDMENPGLAMSRVQFAFAYDRGFDPSALLAYLSRREAMGGLSSDELRALLSIRLNQNDARGVTEVIARHRDLAEQSFGKPGMLSLEFQALVHTGEVTSAKLMLEQNAAVFDAETLAAFRVEIAKAEGEDPVAAHLKLYEETKTPESLRALVAVLLEKKDHNSIAYYAELLYEETRAPPDIALSAEAYIKAGDNENFVRIYEAHPFLKDVDAAFSRHYAWQLFRLGRQQEARLIAEALARDPKARDLNLEIAVALETGEWESLSASLSAFLQGADQREGLSLIRAAKLAHAAGQGPAMDLMNAAVRQGGTDPNVLLGAYTILIEEGLEETKPEAQEWFRKALALSGPGGPIQAFELKEILAKQAAWNEQTRRIQENVSRGDMPMVVASSGLNTTVVDIVLRNLVRNTELDDGRRRVAIPLFGGRRPPTPPGRDKTATFDVTALLVLAWLGLLPKAIAAYERIVLPAGVLAELFEGRSRIRHTQKSRLRKAHEVREAIANQGLKILRAPAIARDALSAEVGPELAALLREAESADGVVVRSAPVRRISVEDAEADLLAHANRLCDMHGLLKTLAELNAIDEQTETAAKRYFTLQDRGWPSSPALDVTKPLFLDGLSVTYLQTTGLWHVLLRTFKNVYIHDSTAEEAAVLIEYDKHVAEVFHLIDVVRSSIRDANREGKVTFGPQRLGADAADPDRDIGSTLNLLANLDDAGIAYFDDRALNKEAFAEDSRGRRVKTATTLDLIEELRTRDVISEQERRTLRYRLRAAGAMLVPVDGDEVAAAASRNKQKDSPEFRAMRESLDLARLSEMPQFPGEMAWFVSFVNAAKLALARIWNTEADEDRAAKLSRSILGLRPMPEDWVGRWQDGPPPNWVSAVARSMAASLCIPLEITKPAKVTAYQKWLESELTTMLRSMAPETYEEIVVYLRDFIQMPWNEDAEETED